MLRLASSVLKRSVSTQAARSAQGLLPPAWLKSAAAQRFVAQLQEANAKLMEHLAAAERASAALLAEKSERLAEKNERLAAAERASAELLAEKSERLAAVERASAELLAEKSERLAAAERSAEQRLASAAKLLEAVERSSGFQQVALQAELTQARYASDIARGKIAVRCVLDTSLAEVFRMSGKTSPGGSKFMGAHRCCLSSCPFRAPAQACRPTSPWLQRTAGCSQSSCCATPRPCTWP